MKFEKHFIDEVRNRVSITDVIASEVNLKPKGKGEFLGLCPFHNEKTPSFTVSENKGFYHCFGCGAHGDSIRYVMERRGLPYPEAIKTLAQQAGMELPKPTKYDVKKQKNIDDSFEIMELATDWFQKNLKSDKGLKARSYLKNRGLSKDIIEKFRIGYVEDEWEGLKKYLSSKNVSENLMLENGLITKSQNGDRKYDRFRGRVIFPIFDYSGKVIAFGGRIIEEKENSPKYLNSPETPIFKKGYVLFGYNFARDEAFKKNQVIVVEGYMDAIAMHQAGIENVVAPLGTAITENHIKQIWKMTQKPVFCLDGDKAGIRASKRLAEDYINMLKPGYSMRFCFLKGGKDPDEIIKSKGVANFKKQIENSETLSETLWNLNKSERKLKTPEDKALFANDLYKIIGRIEDPTVRNFYRREYNNKLFKLDVELNKDSKKGGFSNNKFATNLKTLHNVASNVNFFEESKKRLAFAIIYNPWLLNLSEVDEIAKNLDFYDKNLEKIVDLVIDFSSFVDSERASIEGFLEFLENKKQQSHIVFLNKNPLRNEFDYEFNNEKALTAWRYLLSEYNLNLAKEEINKLLDNLDSNPELFSEGQKELLKLQDIRDKNKIKYETLLEID
jgi:DNA primase